MAPESYSRYAALIMRTISAIFLLLVALQPFGSAQSKPTAPVFDIKVCMKKLTSDEFAGRAHPHVEKTRLYLQSEFERAKLEPSFPNYRMKFAHAGFRGENIVGIKRSTHKKKLPGHIIVSAHFDHLGRRGGKVYRGACDNASGVAAMLQLAFELQPSEIRRDIVFIGFDLEERGLLGSYAYAEKPALPLKDCAFFLTADMLGRKALGLVESEIFVQGWEWTPGVLKLIEAASEGAKLNPSFFWTDITGDRSDFVAFKKKRVRHLFFSVGQNPDYHLPSDTLANLDLKLLERQVSFIKATAMSLANLEVHEPYRQVPDLNLAEFESLRRLAKLVSESSDKSVRTDTKSQALFLYNFAQKVIRAGKVTSRDRATLLRLMKAVKQGARR